MADEENDIVPPIELGDTEETANIIRSVTAGTEALEDADGSPEIADGSRPVTAGAADGVAEADASDNAPNSSERPASARPESARPPSARPASARPPSARPASARPESAKPTAERPTSVKPDSRPPSGTPDAAQPPSARPASGRPSSAKPAPVRVTTAEEGQPLDQVEATETKADAAEAPEVPTSASREGEAAGEGEGDAAGSNHGHHPDVITDIDESPEARAEIEEIAQQQAREVIRSRQSSACSERKVAGGGGVEDDKRRSSASNGSVRSSPPSRHGPNETIANMAMQPPSPSKIKSGPWLSGTYRLPKSGKIISGEELCDALERMTNAYIDKYTHEKSGGLGKEQVPATVFNTKKLTQDEYDVMIARLYKPKDRIPGDNDRIQQITLKFGEEGQEQWVPVKTVSPEEQKAYMCELYQRCLDNRKKTQQELAEKYLKPLGAPRKK